ncbi:hypothetical protein [Caldimonas thermodepolymerans]|jgi:hypothetical protein|uniref:hypothetical protein n=1 Tax=Caldimonas thermodepolymerans TaxID=215580 RepID=UPI002491A5F7|nr:hypothetical protein [Caldimonas thermodepolymerans]
MTQDDSSSSSEQSNPRKNGLNLDLLFRPATAAPTSLGTLYLYGLRTSDPTRIDKRDDFFVF